MTEKKFWGSTWPRLPVSIHKRGVRLIVFTEVVAALVEWGEDVAKSRSWKPVVFVVWRIYGPVNFGAVEISKEMTVEAMCDEFSKGI